MQYQTKMMVPYEAKAPLTIYYMELVRQGLMTLNDAREALGMPPIEEKEKAETEDDFKTALNKVVESWR